MGILTFIGVSVAQANIGQQSGGVSGDGARTHWRIVCPCGVAVEYPRNGLPKVDTLHLCGNKNHWTVKYDSGAEQRVL